MNKPPKYFVGLVYSCFLFLISFYFFPVLLPVFGCTSSAHPRPWQKHLSLCSPAKAWCHSGSSSTDRELILPLLCLARPAWVDGKGWFWVELTMSSQLDLNCKTDYLCKSMLWCWTISVTLLFLFSRVFFLNYYLCLNSIRMKQQAHIQRTFIPNLMFAALHRSKSKKTKQKRKKPWIRTVQHCC